MAKTIKDLADELGYSKTYLNQVIKQLKMQSSLRKIGNKFVIGEELEKALKQALEEKSQTEERQQIENKTQSSLQLSLQSEIEHLREQILIKDGQIAQFAQLLDQQQQLLLNEQKQSQLLLEQSEELKDELEQAKHKKWYQFWK